MMKLNDSCLCSSLLDSDTGESVAIKKLRDEFCSKKTTKRTPREIKILRHMDYENVLSVALKLDVLF